MVCIVIIMIIPSLMLLGLDDPLIVAANMFAFLTNYCLSNLHSLAKIGSMGVH